MVGDTSLWEDCLETKTIELRTSKRVPKQLNGLKGIEDPLIMAIAMLKDRNVGDSSNILKGKS